MREKQFLLPILFCIIISFTQLLCARSKELTPISEGRIFSLKHYPKFYGDQNTSYGNFYERSYLWGSFSGLRDALSCHGIYLDATLFQFLAANLTGGAKHGYMRYNGNAEYWLVFDTAKMGIWSRGALSLHAESSWTAQDSINDDVGSLLATNDRSRVPVPGKNATTLSEVVLEQHFSDHFLFRVGKMDATGPIDATEFGNNGRFQFTYAGLVNNPIIYHFTSYTSLAIMPIWNLPDNKNQLLLFIADANGTANQSPFNSVFNGQTSYCIQYTGSPKVRNHLPGNYRLIYAHNRKPLTSYKLDARHLIGKDIPEIKIPKKCNNHAFLFNFDQYVWINPDNEHVTCRNHRPPIGILLFGRAGWEPKDRNVIDQFYSIGIGSYGGFRNRYYDQWGLGYAATHISCMLRKALKEQQGILFTNFEHAFEFFYDVEITPALNLSFHSKIIRPPLQSHDAALVIDARLRADF